MKKLQGKKFAKVALGFKPADVNEYIETILQKYSHEFKKKDEEISLLRSQLELNGKLKIADVLIKAQEKADLIISDANTKATEETVKINKLITAEHERLSEIRGDIKRLKRETSTLLKQYELQLDDAEQKTMKFGTK